MQQDSRGRGTRAATSIEAEEAVLGSILIDASAYSRIVPELAESDFTHLDHRLIYSAITALIQRGVPPDPVTLIDELKRMDKEVGISISALASNTPTAANVEHYANIVRERALQRRTLAVLDKSAAAVMGGERPVIDILNETEGQIAKLKSLRSAGYDRQRLQALDIREFLTREIPPRGYLLKPIIPEQGLLMVHGWRGIGKTHVSVGIAVAVAAGGSFLRWTAPAPAGVLFIDGEMPASKIQLRFADAIRASNAEPRASLRLVTPDFNRRCGMPDLATEEGQRAVDALVLEDTRLIIVDNLSSLLRTGVENESESWLPLQTWALRHRADGRGVLFIHHGGKGGAQRGTSRREDVLDTVIALRRPTDYREVEGARFELHIEKGRALFGDDAAAFEAKLGTTAAGLPAWGMRDLEENLTKRIAELAGMGMKPGEIAQELNIHKSTVYRRLQPTSGDARAGAGHA